MKESGKKAVLLNHFKVFGENYHLKVNGTYDKNLGNEIMRKTYVLQGDVSEKAKKKASEEIWQSKSFIILIKKIYFPNQNFRLKMMKCRKILTDSFCPN